MDRVATERSHEWWLFAVWGLLGMAWSFTFVGLASIGLLLLPLALLSTAVLSRLDSGLSGLPGLLPGLGIAPLLVAYLNRDGPGEVCTHTVTSTSCGQEWSPWPWMLVGIVLVSAGLIWFRVRAHSAG